MLIYARELLSEVHSIHNQWLKELDFYKYELTIFQGKLQEKCLLYTSYNFKVAVEQFHNRFIIHKNEIDLLKHDICTNQAAAVEAGKLHLKRIDYTTSEEFRLLETRFHQFEKLYKELKKEYLDFLCKYI